jgi:rfaE bifunctional protein kinase chain/domain
MQELKERYGQKIRTPEEIKKTVGQRPRIKSVIMCHGVFDIVHPGHLRHMIYAKTKADTLIVSITRDALIDKGQFRPHVPEELRALNVAAFEVVDFVIIDENDTPLKNIELIQPDYFAKGYEYSRSRTAEKTHVEKSLVESYGGEMLFTPGDLVYSSSNLLNTSPPSIQYDKLATLLETEKLTIEELRETLYRLGEKEVHVIGDTIVDSITQTSLIGGQTKTPTISVQYEQKINHVGGAAVVAKHLRATGAKVIFSTILGEDEQKIFVLDDLQKIGVHVNYESDAQRPTTNKNAIVAGGYRLLKIDTVDNRQVSERALKKLTSCIQSIKTDAVVFSDFRHGIFNRQTIPRLIEAIPAGVFRVADSQVASRWGNITEFQNFDLITPNEREARFSLSDQDTHLRALASNLYEAAKCKTLMLTLGERGVLTCRDPNYLNLNAAIFIDSFAENVLDPVGAGDALLAYATLSMLTTQNPAVAMILGSFAAAVECEKNGNIPVRPEDVLEKINLAEKNIRFS